MDRVGDAARSHLAHTRRPAGVGNALPSPGRACQHDRHHRRSLRRPSGDRARSGEFEDECRAYGIELGTLRQRFDRFDEGLEVIDSLLTKERTTFTGSYYQLVDALLIPKPVQQPRPPICIGGQGEQRTLRAVARWADHWNAPALDAETFARKLEVLHRHCADIGRDLSSITVSNLIRYDGTDAVLEQIERFEGLGVDLLLMSVPSPHNPDDVARLGELLATVG